MSTPSAEVSHSYLQQTIELARQSPPKPTNFRVGCVIVSLPNFDPSQAQILSTGYTLELPGNTHAEQSALSKLASLHDLPEDDLSSLLTSELNAVLYTSLEPCGKRLSGNVPCVQRIIATREQNTGGGIRKVVFGAKEPGTFVQDSQSCNLLTQAGIEWEYLPVLESEILAVAMEGHKKEDAARPADETSRQNAQSTSQASTSDEQFGRDAPVQLQERTEGQPRNPKKRMMEAPPDSEASRS